MSVFPDPENLRVEILKFTELAQTKTGFGPLRRRLQNLPSPPLQINSVVELDDMPVAILDDLINEAQILLAEARENFGKVSIEWNEQTRKLPLYQQSFFSNQVELGWYIDVVQLHMACLESFSPPLNEAAMDLFRAKYAPLLEVLELFEQHQHALYRQHDFSMIVTAATVLRSHGVKFLPLSEDVIREEDLAWYLDAHADLAKDESVRREIEKAKASLDLD
ncbi:MAG: hypothetical protein OEL53_05845 [Rhodospirillales bacterium]|nr:hypothetical protein [Rhodospirillales bacterium]